MKKKILIVSDTPTHPVIGGNRMCMLQNAALLQELGYEVFFLLYDFYGNMEAEKGQCENYWKGNFYYFTPSKTYKFIHKIASKFFPSLNCKVDFFCSDSLIDYVNKLDETEKFDGLIVNYVWLSKLSKTNIPRKALYTHDVFSNRNERIKASYKWMYFSPNQESKALHRFENVLAIQQNEAVFFKLLSPVSKVSTIYSPVEYNNQPVTGNHKVLFFSGGGELNLLGLGWYLQNIHPLVIKSLPDYTLCIGGKICDSLDKNNLDDNTQLYGLFDNVANFYKLGDVAINPTYSGSGLKIKTIEAISYGKYTIVHPHSAEGLYGQPPLIVSDDPDKFSQSIIYGLTDRSLIEEQKHNCEEYCNSMSEHIKAIYKSLFENTLNPGL